MKTYHEYLIEGEDFETEIVDSLSNLQIGDEVFWRGRWQQVYKDGVDAITIGLPGDLQRITQAEISRFNQGILKKISNL